MSDTQDTRQLVITIKGTSPLLMHNPQMVDPDFHINRELKVLTSKRTRTTADREQIEYLEWMGGLYVDGDVVVQPTSKLRKALVETARITKQGKGVERAVMFDHVYEPLAYDGPKDITSLALERQKFSSKLSVGVNGKRVMRVRPSFDDWSLTLTGTFIANAGLNDTDVVRIAELAGKATGIGDNRVNGYGRFTAEVEIES